MTDHNFFEILMVDTCLSHRRLSLLAVWFTNTHLQCLFYGFSKGSTKVVLSII